MYVIMTNGKSHNDKVGKPITTPPTMIATAIPKKT